MTVGTRRGLLAGLLLAAVPLSACGSHAPSQSSVPPRDVSSCVADATGTVSRIVTYFETMSFPSGFTGQTTLASLLSKAGMRTSSPAFDAVIVPANFLLNDHFSKAQISDSASEAQARAMTVAGCERGPDEADSHLLSAMTAISRETASTKTTAPTTTAPTTSTTTAPTTSTTTSPTTSPSAPPRTTPTTPRPAPTTTTPAARIAELLDCVGHRAAVQPRNILLQCRNGHEFIHGAVWTHWGAPQATATATLYKNDCIPSCSAGVLFSEPATITVSALGVRDGTYEYGQIQVVPDAPNRHDVRTWRRRVPG